MTNPNQTTPQTKRIEAYSMAEFLQQVRQAIREGYELDLNTNENYPQQFGTLFTCGVVKVVDVVKAEVQPATQDEAVVVKRGRKPAGV